ncbi:hypothetical protein GWK47_021931 [Chionoecetes opilio]|uniref:Uncharacterized protein n=1 Tax=Chionoecetes opilio TaxID=41210 RepID=A0A8J4XP03_CHIOP|nr:hypothetical protein GWK47_021931 [Chionoecetes opilio]
MSPIIPFLAVVALQSGIPVAVIGSMVAASMLMVVVMKPFLAVLADTFPSYRRTIFLMTLVVVVWGASVSLNFVTPMKGFSKGAGAAEACPGDCCSPPTTPGVHRAWGVGGRGEGPRCLGVGTTGSFDVYTAARDGTFAFNTAVSVTDAIIVDTIGKMGTMGIQRAWAHLAGG